MSLAIKGEGNTDTSTRCNVLKERSSSFEMQMLSMNGQIENFC